MQKFLIAAVALIVVCGGYYLWSKGSDTGAYDDPPQELSGVGVVGSAVRDSDPFDITITYTSDGYSPRDVSIKKGTRVRFLNDADEATWPASGVHPTHSLYPEKLTTDCLGSSFDSCRGLEKGEFYDYTFYYLGDWPYHDHEHAYHSGVITVTE